MIDRDIARAAKGLVNTRPPGHNAPDNVPWKDPDWLKARRAENMTAEQIGARAGCHAKTVEYWLRQFGLPRLQPGHPDGKWHDVNWVREQMAKNLTIDDMAALAGCSYSTMQQACVAARPVAPEPRVWRWWEHRSDEAEPVDCLDCRRASCEGCQNDTH